MLRNRTGEVPFTDLGDALPGPLGLPTLVAAGELVPGESWSVALTGAPPSAATVFAVGSSLLQLPFQGGVLVPAPEIVTPPVPTTPGGSIVLPSTWPADVPAGATLYVQAWISESETTYTASNGLSITTP